MSQSPTDHPRGRPKEATAATRGHHASVLQSLPFRDTQDFTDASRGFVASLPEVEIANDQGRVVWSLRDYAFLAQKDAPDTVNPSLWRQARLNMHNGLFQVTNRIYQVRGFDISNMTIIEGDEGVIIIDPLVCRETAQAALDLYYAHRGQRPVMAVIYSHSHVDHYGGVKGVIEEAAMEQLGYQAESTTWRNAYLQGAHELRQGLPQSLTRAPVSPDMINALPAPLFFDYLAVRLNGPKAEGKHIVINWAFPDSAKWWRRSRPYQHAERDFDPKQKNTKKCRSGKNTPILLISFSKRAARAHPENPICKWRFGSAGYSHREGKIAWHASDIVSPASRIGGR